MQLDSVPKEKWYTYTDASGAVAPAARRSRVRHEGPFR